MKWISKVLLFGSLLLILLFLAEGIMNFTRHTYFFTIGNTRANPIAGFYLISASIFLSIVMYKGFISEIKYKKLLGQQLEQSEEQYHRMIESVEEYAILMIDLDGQILNWNVGAERIKGYSAKEIIGKNFRLFYPDEAREKGIPQKLLQQALKEGKAADEGIRVKKDGSEFWATVLLTTIRDSEGVPIGFSKVTRDITERKKAEEALVESQRQFDAFMSTLPAVAWMLDAKGFFQYHNSGFAHTFNNDQPVIGKHLTELAGHEAFEKVVQTSLKTLNGFEPLETVESTISFPREKKILKFYMFPIGRGDRGLLGGIGVDITAMVKADEDVRMMNEKLITTNGELNQFANVVSHDLQEPLRMVTSFLQLLEKKYAHLIDDSAKEYINYAVNGAERMKLLISDLLKFSRLNDASQTFIPVDMNQVLTSVLMSYKTVIIQKEISIHIQELPEIVAHRTQMEQLFQNLISNAVKYHGPDKPVIEIGSRAVAGGWEFYVRDNGIGIEEKFFEKIFVIFQRLHGRSSYTGTGIGLAICKKIVERHGGKIWLESSPGKGSVFYFTILTAKFLN